MSLSSLRRAPLSLSLSRNALAASAWRPLPMAIPPLRQFSSSSSSSSGCGGCSFSSSKGFFLASALGGFALFTLLSPDSDVHSAGDAKLGVDYGAVRKVIASLLDADGYDDGSRGPLFVRLAWHASGTFSKVDGSGGSDGGRIRFNPEAAWGANKGLQIARDVLEPVYKSFPGLTHADLYTLAGVVAVEEMGGPTIPWRPGRIDLPDGKTSPPDGRLPDAAQGAKHVRDIFYRMGFNDQEIVALIGAHSLGRCHTDRSGYDGPWTHAPTTFSNEFFRLLLEEKWTERKWKGPKQLENKDKDIMMLPADFALFEDPAFNKWVIAYAKDEDLFRKDFAKAFSKLLELGCKFAEQQKKEQSAGKPWYKKIFG